MLRAMPLAIQSRWYSLFARTVVGPLLAYPKPVVERPFHYISLALP